MGTMINRRRVMGGGEKLPYGAVRIEYLEGTGTSTNDMQFIDTGIYCVDDVLKIQCKAGFTNLSRDWGSLFGLYAGDSVGYNYGSSLCLNRNGNTTNYGTTYNRTNITINKQISVGTFSEIIYEKTLNGVFIYMDGELIWSNELSVSICKEIPIFILCKSDIRYRTGRKININEYCPSRFYYCKIYDANNTLVRDFIPVRVGNVGYMYDKVSGQLFGNSGTGSFILGPDV